ncbi:hypothetical protein ACFOWE_01110 [Planomonospora corallina]|uniref:Uncharacterized protein n=1 Tax=Planomonospora corallina TaxID=1806052 RepID=A0ABV8I1C1_9ACTN
MRVWDLRTARLLREARAGILPPLSVAITGTLVLAADHRDVVAWDLAGDGPVLGVATAHVGGRPVAVTCGQDRTLRTWDLRTGEQTAPPALPLAGLRAGLAPRRTARRGLLLGDRRLRRGAARLTGAGGAPRGAGVSRAGGRRLRRPARRPAPRPGR